MEVPQRVYVIPYFKVEGRLKTLLGTEAAVSGRALFDLKKMMTKDTGDTAAKRLVREALEAGKSIINRDTGKCIFRGLFHGRNLGGILLYGRPALPGGRMEKRDRSIRHACLREFVEEFKLPREVLDSNTYREARRVFMENLKMSGIGVSTTGRKEQRTYFTLDLDAVKDFASVLHPNRIVENFHETNVVHTIEEMWECDDKEDPMLQTEKRDLKCSNLSNLTLNLTVDTVEDVEFMYSRMLELARVIVKRLSVAKNLRDSAAGNLANDLVAYQLSRSLPEQAQITEKAVSNVMSLSRTPPAQ